MFAFSVGEQGKGKTTIPKTKDQKEKKGVICKTHRDRQVGKLGKSLVIGMGASQTRGRQNNHILVRSNTSRQVAEEISGQLIEGDQRGVLAIATVNAVEGSIVQVAIVDVDTSGGTHVVVVGGRRVDDSWCGGGSSKSHV